MALTLADADAMIDACRSGGGRLFVVKQNRFNVPVVKLREALDQVTRDLHEKLDELFFVVSRNGCGAGVETRSPNAACPGGFASCARWSRRA
jgi:hypothetical protein